MILQPPLSHKRSNHSPNSPVVRELVPDDSSDGGGASSEAGASYSAAAEAAGASGGNMTGEDRVERMTPEPLDTDVLSDPSLRDPNLTPREYPPHPFVSALDPDIVVVNPDLLITPSPSAAFGGGAGASSGLGLGLSIPPQSGGSFTPLSQRLPNVVPDHVRVMSANTRRSAPLPSWS